MAPYPKLKKEECQGKFGMGPKTFGSVGEITKDLGGAAFLTEFGGVFFTPPQGIPSNGTARLELDWILEDRH